MNSVCILGNSHAAGLHRAMMKTNVTNIDVFAGGFQLLNQVKQSDNTLSFKNPSLSFYSNSSLSQPKSISLLQYKEIIIYGCQIISRANGEYWLNNYYDSVSGLFSDDCIETLHKEALYDSQALKLIQLIQSSNYSGKISLIPSPLPNEKHPYVNLSAGQDTPDVLRSVCNLYEKILQVMNIEFRALPESLLATNNFTSSLKYLDKPSHGKDDFAHLNIEGCNLVLNEVLKSRADIAAQ